MVQCQSLGILPKSDPSLQAVWIISTVHGYLSLANDNRISSLLGEGYSESDVQDYVMAAIFQGLGGVAPT